MLSKIYHRLLKNRFFNIYILPIPFVQKFRVYMKRRDAFSHGKKIDDALKEIENSGEVPLFSHVEIETVNRCNGTCSFCPVNAKADTREYKKMPDELFHKIIDELEELDYHGELNMFSNNEPLLDERFEEFIKVARTKLPKARIKVSTNGTLLTIEKLKNIAPYLDYLQIDNYNDKMVMNKPVQAVYDYCADNKQIGEKVHIELIRTNAVRNTRGGQAPNNKGRYSLPISCLMVYNQFVIRPDGKVSLCCQDALGKYTMGDVSEQKMAEIWHSKQYTQIRQSLKNGRGDIELCRYCDAEHPGVWSIGNEHCLSGAQ